MVAYVRGRHSPQRVARAGVALLIGFLAVLGAGRVVDLLPSLSNPFADETVDRSQPAVLDAVVELQELRAATANLQVVVDIEQDARNLPTWLKGERTVMVAAGTVDAVVDLAGLRESDVVVSEDRRTVHLTVPRPRLEDARLDMDRTEVVSRERGVIDRVNSALGDGSDDSDLYRIAEQRLDEAAAADERVIDQARASTRATLSQLLRRLGFEEVRVEFRGA